jgi:hypothetical protein
MIGIGINENVMISAADFDEKKRLYIELKEAKAGAAAPASIFDELLTAGVTGDGKNMQLKFLSPLTSKKEDITRAQKIDYVGNDIKKLKNQLTQILQQYMVTDAIDFQTTLFEGTGIVTGEDYTARILDQDVLDKIYVNMSKRFVELITPFVGNPEYALRFKLVRQSKDKNFARVPDRYISDRPFVELMTVPKEASKVKFDKWEIDNGLNSSAPVSQSTAEDKQDASAAVIEENPFASRP